MTAIGNAQIKLLERLCNASAVSGDEAEVRSIVLEQVRKLTDEVQVDALGNVLVRRTRPGGKRLKVMLAAHMDEVGFMLVGEEGEGIYRFETVGNIDLRQLPGKAVLIGRDHVPGVIGAKPIHLTSAEERSKLLTQDTLRIDTGAEGGVKLGDRAVFATRFARNGSVLFAKALDDRLGLVLLLELLRNPPASIDLLAAFTVQEEVGMRGARVAAYALNPDIAMVVDATPARDLPTWDDEENAAFNTRLGQGPAIYVADNSTLYDRRLVQHFIQTAQKEGIPHQIRQPGQGGTDAGAIHLSREGIPSISVSTPNRHGHSSISVVRLEDWKNTFALLQAALQGISPDVLKS